MMSKFLSRFKINLELEDKVPKRNVFKLTYMCRGIAPSHETFRKNPAGYRFFKIAPSLIHLRFCTKIAAIRLLVLFIMHMQLTL